MLHTAPLVSIVMPTHNRAAYIQETIRSIQAQTYANWELVIVDDDSDDDTEAVVMAITDKRIRYSRQPHTGSVSCVRNAGLKLIQGTLVAFMDSDDLWHPEYLQKQTDALARYPQAGYSLTNGYNFYQPGIATYYFNPQQMGELSGNLFIPFCEGRFFTFAQALILCRELLDSVGIFSEHFRDTTFGFMGELTFAAEGVFLYEPLFYRRLHNTNATLQHEAGHLQYFIDTVKTFAQRNMLPVHTMRQILFKAHIHTGEYHAAQGRTLMALQHFMRAWGYRPVSIIPFKKALKAILGQ